MTKVECANATKDHISEVGDRLIIVVKRLLDRLRFHDISKLQEPELTLFTEYTPKLKKQKYGSKEYKTTLLEMKKGLDHHYMYNSHHPEYFGKGIQGMTLIDIMEMLCDWSASVARNKDGSIFESIELNQKRFGYSDELKNILFNTVNNLFGG